MALLTAEQVERVGRAVAQAEAKTSGELVVLIAQRSQAYVGWRCAVTLICVLPLVDVLGWQFPGIGLTALLLLGVVGGGALFWLSGLGACVRFIVPEAERERSVQERALRAMMEHGVTDTRDRSGVLIFLSELEHRVVLLADRGINERVSTEEWNQDVRALISALKDRDAEGGLLRVIERVGGLLEQHFPPRADDRNELPDAPRLI